MFSRIFLTLMLFFAAALPAGAEDNPIAVRMKLFTDAYNAGDAAAIADLYAEDGAVLIPRGGIAVGRDAVAKHYAAAFEAGVANLQYKILEIRKVGPATAVEIGETRVLIKEQTAASRSMHVWVFKDGEWFLSRDIYQVLGAVKQ